MPAPTRRLTAALHERRVHKRAVEVSARAFDSTPGSGNLFYDPDARRAGEMQIAAGTRRGDRRTRPARGDPDRHPQTREWRTDVWVPFDAHRLGSRP